MFPNEEGLQVHHLNVKLWLPHRCSVLKYFLDDFEVYQEKLKKEIWTESLN